MRKNTNIILLFIGLTFFSCEKFLEPKIDGTLSEGQVLNDPVYAEGILLRAYVLLPDDYNFGNDVASDDAVTNDLQSTYRRMATGEWKASFYPGQAWTSAYEQIYYTNKFLLIYNDVLWARDPRLSAEVNAFKNALYKKRMKGEAYGLRAYAKARLLQYHGGATESGELLGYPIVSPGLSSAGDWKLPRATFQESVNDIFRDCDSAIANLPLIWKDLLTTSGYPPENVHLNTAYQGVKYLNRINGSAVRAIKAQVALLAASPAFSASSGVTYADAATIAGSLLDTLGTLYNNSVTYYKEISNKEMIWHRARVSKRTWEQNNFPPSLYGYGRTNPSQNLVDAFPMSNGYPISHASSGYNADNPYAGRDNRFREYIIYNNAIFKGATIGTYEGAAQNGINMGDYATRTGYYLKKFMLEGVSVNPGSPLSTNHTYTLLRMTELLLNYAEAANEAWGPTADPNGYGFSAKVKIGELRARAGIGGGDPYLASITTTEGLRDLIRNERRVSLCFEGFRFWDIRRWNDVVTMKAPVKSMHITQVDGVVTDYNVTDVEDREYTDHMIYGPVPYNETLKYNLIQNKGW